MLSIQVGTCTADNRLVDKTSFITLGSPVNCEVYHECSIMSPTFLLAYNSSYINCNYLYVSAWHRYYFIVDETVAPGGRIYLSCQEDVLMSNKNEIKALSGYLVRTEDNKLNNKYIYDKRHPYQENRKCRTYDFNRSPFTANYAQDVVYILTVVGGHHS